MLSLIAMGTVFGILILLVWILQVFGMLGAKSKTQLPASSSKSQTSSAQPIASADADDQAVVAVALYLYQNDAHDTESGVLTIHQTQGHWHSELNPWF